MTSSANQHVIGADDGPETDPPVFVEIRRRRWVAALIALGALGVSAAYLVRLSTIGFTWVDWTVLGFLVLISGSYLAALADSRAPLLVADEHGVRARRGSTWRGVSWPEVAVVEHHPRAGLLQDGWVAIEDLEGEAIRVPLSLSTRIMGVEPAELTSTIVGLCGAQTEVVELREPEPEPAAEEKTFSEEPPAAVEVAAGAQGHEEADEQEDESAVLTPTRASATPVPLRSIASGVRAQITRTRVSAAQGITQGVSAHATEGATALQRDLDDTAIRLPEIEHLRRGFPGTEESFDVTSVRGRLVEESPAPETPVARVVDPVIGPVLAQARIRIGLSVDQVAERTRIRPHVIEAIEVDDFGPCGGDFYARGHLRTLSRVLGVDATPLLSEHAERYADAPIDPRKVFEADLAAGSSGSSGLIRATRGGPNWSVLIAAVMTVVLIWSVARLIMDNPAAVEPVAPPLNKSGGLTSGTAAAPEVPVVLTAGGGGARVIVRNSSEIVFNAPLAFGQSTTLRVSPPIRISSSDGSLNVSVDGDDRGPMGETGQEAQATYVVR